MSSVRSEVHASAGANGALAPGLALGHALGLAFGITLSMAACAVAAVPSQEVRLLLKTSTGTSASTPSGASADGEAAALARRVSEDAKVAVESVKYVAANGGDWHSVIVRCANTAQCDEVVARLRADTTHFSAVQLDERRTPGPVQRSKAQ